MQPVIGKRYTPPNTVAPDINAPGVTLLARKKNAAPVLPYALALHSDFDDLKHAA